MGKRLHIINTSGSAFPLEGTIIPHLGDAWIDEENMRSDLEPYVVGDDGGQNEEGYQVPSTALASLARLITFEINEEGELVAIGEAADELSINDEGELIMQVGT